MTDFRLINNDLDPFGTECDGQLEIAQRVHHCLVAQNGSLWWLPEAGASVVDRIDSEQTTPDRLAAECEEQALLDPEIESAESIIIDGKIYLNLNQQIQIQVGE